MIRRILALSLSLLLLFTAACAAPDQSGDDGPDPGGGTSLPAPPPPEDGAPTADGPSAGEPAQGEAEPSADVGDDAGEGRRPIDPEGPMVALTYDDGPHAEYTDQILDILEENRAAATFFEVGRNLYNDADAVRRAEAMGCEVGSHSYRHADLGKLSREAILADLDKADANFQDVLGRKPTLLRPPYGSVSRTLRSATGRSLIAWSIDTEDWRSRDVEKILAAVQGAGDLNGQVILMHSTYDTSVEASRRLIPWLIEEGYQLVTVTELITLHYGDTLQANGLYNYEYFHFGWPVSLPAAAPVQPPADVPDQPPETPETPGDPGQGPADSDGGQEDPDQPPAEDPPGQEDPGQETPTDPGGDQSSPAEQPPGDTASGEEQSDHVDLPPAVPDQGDAASDGTADSGEQ